MGIHAGNRARPAYSGQQRFVFPPEVTVLFKPRPALPFLPAPRARRANNRLRPMSGLAAFVCRFESRDDYLSRAETRSAKHADTPARRREEARVSAAADVALRVARMEKKEAAERVRTGDAFCTAFVYRLWRGTGSAALRADFATFGRVVQVVVPTDRKGIGRGYAFIEFADERELKDAVRGGRGRLVDGKRIEVDVERGRTVRGFLPNRLDGPHNAAAVAGRKILGGKGSIPEAARRRLAEGEPKIVIPVYEPPKKVVEKEREADGDRGERFGFDGRGGGFRGGGFRGRGGSDGFGDRGRGGGFGGPPRGFDDRGGPGGPGFGDSRGRGGPGGYGGDRDRRRPPYGRGGSGDAFRERGGRFDGGWERGGRGMRDNRGDRR